MQSLQLAIRPTIFSRKKILTINSEFVELDAKDLVANSPTRLLRSDIESFRFGIKWINGYQFVIGRIFYIDIRSKSGRVLKLRMKSIYGIRKKLLADKYAKIINSLYDNFFDDIIRQFLIQFDQNVDFELGGLVFSQRGILFDRNFEFISWDEIETKSYWEYYSIYPRSNPNSYKSFDYLHDWDARIVYSVSRQILKTKGMFND